MLKEYETYEVFFLHILNKHWIPILMSKRKYVFVSTTKTCQIRGEYCCSIRGYSLLTFLWHAKFPPAYCCNTFSTITVEKHIFAHTAFQLTFPKCETCCGGAFVMKQCYHQSLSAGNIELPLLSTLMGNPHRDGLAHLIKCSEPHRQIICTRGTSMTEKKKKSLIQTRTGTICIVIK